MPAEIKPLGILAGEGALPLMLIDHCLKDGIPVCAVQFEGCDYADWNVPIVPIFKTRIEKVGEIFKFFKSHGVQNVVMIGNLQRPSLTSLRPDWRGLKTLGRIAKAMTGGGDDTLLKTLRHEIEAEGFHVVGIDYYLKNLTAEAGEMTTSSFPQRILKQVQDDAIAEALRYGREDKGQSILWHSDGTYSYEGREGTTSLIMTYGRQGSILIKMMKPQQDPDLDRPTVGIQTLQALNEKKCAGMIIQADAVFLVDKPAMVHYANEHDLFIEAVRLDHSKGDSLKTVPAGKYI